MATEIWCGFFGPLGPKTHNRSRSRPFPDGPGPDQDLVWLFVRYTRSQVFDPKQYRKTWCNKVPGILGSRVHPGPGYDRAPGTPGHGYDQDPSIPGVLLGLDLVSNFHAFKYCFLTCGSGADAPSRQEPLTRTGTVRPPANMTQAGIFYCNSQVKSQCRFVSRAQMATR